MPVEDKGDRVEVREWEWRMIVSGTFLTPWMEADPEQQRLVFAAWIEVHRSWQGDGCRLIATMDNLTAVGPAALNPNFSTIWEIPSPNILHVLWAHFWNHQAKYDLKLASYFSLTFTIGKPIVSMERALGGPLAATTPSGPGSFEL